LYALLIAAVAVITAAAIAIASILLIPVLAVAVIAAAAITFTTILLIAVLAVAVITAAATIAIASILLIPVLAVAVITTSTSASLLLIAVLAVAVITTAASASVFLVHDKIISFQTEDNLGELLFRLFGDINGNAIDINDSLGILPVFEIEVDFFFGVFPFQGLNQQCILLVLRKQCEDYFLAFRSEFHVSRFLLSVKDSKRKTELQKKGAR
jgi:hypothetical protein